jgi:hypothetical protein
MTKKIELDEFEIGSEERKKIIDNIIKGKNIKENAKIVGYPKQEMAIISENKGQLLIRIPKLIREKLQLKAGQKVHFNVYAKDGETKIELEVIENAT